MSYSKTLEKILVVAFTALSAGGAAADGFNAMYVIGDSLSDQGNLFNATQRSTGNGVPASDHYYQGRFSNGENYAGVLARKLGVRLKASSEGGTNFAYGGARTDYNVVEADVTKPFPVSLLAQGGGFPEDAFPWTINGQKAVFTARHISNPDAFYVVFNGSNDIADLINMVATRAANPAFPAIDPHAVIAKVVRDIDAAFAAAVAAGARDVLLPNVPNFGVVPRVTRSGPAVAGLASALTQQYNAALAAMLTTWNGRVNVIPFDLYSLSSEVAARPAAFGFSNASSPCYSGFVSPAGPADTVCATPLSYVFWDDEHPTAAFHAVLADRMAVAVMLDIFDDLAERLRAVQAPKGVMTSLGAKLTGVRRLLTDAGTANDAAAAAKLKAFVLAVEGQQRKGDLASAEAAVLVERAEKVIFLVKALRS
ncbi:MAG: SGNH/GDSL hydrolase family protein [Pseudomonadota bacterium]